MINAELIKQYRGNGQTILVLIKQYRGIDQTVSWHTWPLPNDHACCSARRALGARASLQGLQRVSSWLVWTGASPGWSPPVARLALVLIKQYRGHAHTLHLSHCCTASLHPSRSVRPCSCSRRNACASSAIGGPRLFGPTCSFI